MLCFAHSLYHARTPNASYCKVFLHSYNVFGGTLSLTQSISLAFLGFYDTLILFMHNSNNNTYIEPQLLSR